MSIIELRIPRAEPCVSFLLRSAMNADVAGVTTERLNLNGMLSARSGMNDLRKERLPMHITPINAPKISVAAFRVCLKTFPLQVL